MNIFRNPVARSGGNRLEHFSGDFCPRQIRFPRRCVLQSEPGVFPDSLIKEDDRMTFGIAQKPPTVEKPDLANASAESLSTPQIHQDAFALGVYAQGGNVEGARRTIALLEEAGAPRAELKEYALAALEASGIEYSRYELDRTFATLFGEDFDRVERPEQDGVRRVSTSKDSEWRTGVLNALRPR